MEIESEVPVSIYLVDIKLTKQEKSLGLEISDPVMKNIRAGYPSPGQRIRLKVLEKNGLKVIELNTRTLLPDNGWKTASEEAKAVAIKSFVLN